MAATKTFGDIGVDYGDNDHSYIGGLMSDRWVVASPWNTVNTWSTAEGGANGAAIPTPSDNVWLSDTSFSGNFTIDADSTGTVNCLALATTSAVTGGTDDYTGTIDLNTLNLNASGLITIGAGATLSMGVSVDTGLTTVGFKTLTGAFINGAVDSIINNSGIIDMANSVTWSLTPAFIFTQTASTATAKNGAIGNVFDQFIVPDGVVITLSGSTVTFVGNASERFEMKGASEIDLNGNIFTVGCKATGSFILSTGCDFSGAGTLHVVIMNPDDFTNNKTGAFTFTGIVLTELTTNFAAITGDWSNGDYKIQHPSAASRTATFTSGLLKSIGFTIQKDSNGSFTVDASNNPSFEHTGDVLFNEGAGSGGFTYNKSNGTRTLTGGAANIDIGLHTTEDLVVDSTAAKTLINNALSFNSITIDKTNPASELNIGVYNTASVGLSDITGKLTIGITADVGYSTGGLTLNSGSKLDMQTDSSVRSTSHISIADEAIFTNPNRGSLILATTANYSNPNSNNVWFDILHDSAANITCTTDSYFTDALSNNNTIEGQIITGGFDLHYGGTGTLLFDLNANITGVGTVHMSFEDSGTFTWNRLSAVSFTGLIQVGAIATGSFIPMIDAGSANILIQGEVAARIFTPTGGANSSLLKIINYTISFAGGNITLNANTNNSDEEISGNIDFYDSGVAETLTYNKGAGTKTLIGNDSTMNCKDQAIENFILQKTAGQKVELKGDVRLSLITGISGKISADSLGTVYSIKAAA